MHAVTVYANKCLVFQLLAKIAGLLQLLLYYARRKRRRNHTQDIVCIMQVYIPAYNTGKLFQKCSGLAYLLLGLQAGFKYKYMHGYTGVKVT